MPDGHLLLQAGKEFEYLTGGFVNCGFHEVIYTDATKDARDKAVKEGRIPWRISSTLFSHIREDVVLEPIDQFKSEPNAKKYTPILVKDYISKELKDIKLEA